VISEGDSQLGAAAARAAFGVDGSGVTVGILSDSFDKDSTAATHAAQDVSTGDLPGTGNPCGNTNPVGRLDDTLAPGEATDEGRGMAQVVHDLAPGARIYFASAFVSETSFAENIRALAAAGARVLVDDVSYLEEPFFQDGPVADAVDEVVAKGDTYFSAAGNDNLISSGRDIGSWEAPAYRDAPKCPALLEAVAQTKHCLDFDPGPGTDTTFGIDVEKEGELTVGVQWAEPWGGVEADIDEYLLDSTGKPLMEGSEPVGSFQDNVGAQSNSTQRPAEVFTWENPGPATEVQLVINRCYGSLLEGGCNEDANPDAMPRLKVILFQNGGGVSSTEYPQSAGGDVVGPTIYGHPGASSAIAVGAERFNNGSAPESYSSRGPVTHYFGPVDGPTPAAPLSSPEVISKPDLVATDCGKTTFFVPVPKTSEFRFCGTSAAAPHAAAVAALALQANPLLTPEEIRADMEATARPVGLFGADAVGAGLVDANALLARDRPKVTITEPPPALGRDSEPSIGFAADRPVTFTCSIDGGALFPCTSPFTPTVPLKDGLHGFAVRGEDDAGRVGTSEVANFTIDTTAPNTFFRAHPRHNIRTRRRRIRAAFRFGSNEAGAGFICRVDGGLPRFCSETMVRRFREGQHSIRVRAVDQAGNSDQTPAVFRFVVRRVGAGSAG
jgi:subtilisin family serine protease